MGKPTYRRKQKVTDAKFQLELGLHLVGWLYLYIVITAVAINLPALRSLLSADIADPEYVEAVFAVRSFSRFVLVPLVVTFIAMAFHAVLLTHRIAGPMYRVKMVLRQMARREFPETVQFRTKDFLHDVAAEMAVTTQALREDQMRVQRMNAETSAAAQRLLEAAESGSDRASLAQIARDVLASAERLDRHVAPPEPEDGAPPAPPAESIAAEPEHAGVLDV
jgi:methyl-accepting chemotaxis protein